MRYLTFRERNNVKFVSDRELTEKEAPRKLTKEEASEIWKFSERIGKNIVNWKYQSVQFGRFCGVIRTDSVTVELLPKIDNSDDDTKGLFIKLLWMTGELNIKKIGQAGLKQQNHHLLDIFIQDFCLQVRNALRGGMITDYVERVENLNAIRGRLQLIEHLRQNAFNQSRLFCRYDERTIDNPFNRVLKAVLHILRQHAVSFQTRTLIISILHQFDGVADQYIRVKDVDALTFDRTNNRWEDIFKQARWFLKGYFPDTRAGKKSGSAFLFDMQDLFEKALGEKIKRECRKYNSSRMRVSLQDSKCYLAKPKFHLIPDIVMWDDKDAFSILDAKWKDLGESKEKIDISPADAYQMNTYADRYECKKIALIFPASNVHRAGRVGSYTLETPLNPTLDIFTIDLECLASDDPMPKKLKNLVFL